MTVLDPAHTDTAGTDRGRTDPSRANSADRTRRRAPWDSVTLITVFVVILVALPTDLRLAALGGAGVPAFIWAMAMGLWWCWSQVHRRYRRTDIGAQPVRAIAFVLLGLVLLSYLVAMERPLPIVEASQADIGILRTLIYLSIVLISYDGVDSLDRLRTLLRRISLAGAALATLGLLQFVTGRSLIEWIAVPGFVRSQSFSAVSERNGFTRSAGTAMNPLEYGTFLAVALPIALTFALYGDRPFWRRWLPVALIGSAMLVSGSRSSLLGLAVIFVILFVYWSKRLKLRMSLLGLAALVSMSIVVPGFLGTMRYLFLNSGRDSSVASRSGSYDIASQFISSSPLFGRGFGTYLPEYRILDNQYLSLAIEIGLVGLSVFVILVLAAAIGALRSRRLCRAPLDRELAPALAASVCAGAVLSAFFDSLAFPMSAGAIFLAIGLAGAYRRLVRTAAVEANDTVAAG